MKSHVSRASPRLSNDRGFAVILTAVFLVVGALGASQHEMWRDELHSWMLARDNSNLWNVFQATRYEPHFVLWRVLLFGITRFTHNPAALQGLSLLLATGTVWIIARFSPFRRLEKCLLCFGYCFLYEYCIIAQDYTMIVLLMFAFCALYRRRTKSYLGLSLVLFLLANTLPYGFLIAVAFAALLAVDRAFNPKTRAGQMPGPTHLRNSLLIVLFGFALAILQLMLVKESPSTSWSHPLTWAGLSQTMINLWRAYVPVPSGFPRPPFWVWGVNFFDEMPSWRWITLGMSLLLGIVSAGLLFARPRALFLYVLGVGILLGAQFFVNIGALRHISFLFLMFVASLWVWGETEERPLSNGLARRINEFFGRLRTPFVLSLLVIHVAVGAYAFSADWVRPFSGAKRAAQYIRDHDLLANAPVIAAPEAYVNSLSAYLERPVYYSQRPGFGSYGDYSKLPPPPDIRRVMADAFQFAEQTHGYVVVVLASVRVKFENGEQIQPGSPARIIASGSVVLPSETHGSPCASIEWVGECPGLVDEDYFLYIVHLQ